MSKLDNTTPTPLPVAIHDQNDGAAAMGEIPREADNTEEWDVGAPPGRELAVGETPVAHDHVDTLPTVDVSVFSVENAVGSSPEGPELPPLVETPTSPLPLDEAEDLATGEIELAEVDDLVEAAQAQQANSGSITPPPVREPVRLSAESRQNVATPIVPPPRITASVAPAFAQAMEESVSDEVELVEDAAASTSITPPPVPATAPPSRSRPVMPPLPVAPVVPSSDPASETWAEPLAARPRRKRTKPWYEEVFDEDYLRTLPFMTAEQTLREVNFIKASLEPPEGGEILDVACGYGRHSIELAQRGLKVTGIDLSLPLLIRAADESQRRALSVNFVHADMREMSFDNQFDGACCMMTSFGYFDEETNLKVAQGIFKGLKPGGRLLIDAINRDYIVTDLPTRVWWEGDGCVVLEEVDFSFNTSRISVRRSVVFQDGRQIEQDISIRAYSLHELGRLFRQAGFRVTEVSGSLATRGHFFGATSRNLLMLCEKPRQ
ncbi:MAG: methyltransferase domain-containing protein [Deltaproteobacteria bacterium]|nr:methyltransferase domain-containing protein [Deltaproteobacteria bacterium]